MKKLKQALKFDDQKPDLSLLPIEALNEVARVMMAGAAKYGRNNWRGGLVYSRVIAAALRHIHAFNSGQDRDEETQTIHLANAICNLMFALSYHEHKRKDLDDRFKG